MPGPELGKLGRRAHGSSDKANFELAAQDLREAIELAQRVGAKSQELRSTIVSSGCSQIGPSRRGVCNLADIYLWFTEDFGTADLKDAKTLLGELTP